MGTSGSGSSAYLRVLELILEEQLELAAGDDSSASADLFAHEIVDLDAPNRCAEIDPGKEVLFYAQGGAPGSGFCLFLDNCTDQELTTVRVVAPSVPGVLASVTTAFEQEELDLVNCQNEQLPGVAAGWFYMECFTLHDDGERVDDFDSANKLCTRIRENLSARLSSNRRRNHNKQHTKRTNSGMRRSAGSGEAPNLARKSAPPDHQRTPSLEEEAVRIVQRINSNASEGGAEALRVLSSAMALTLPSAAPSVNGGRRPSTDNGKNGSGNSTPPDGIATPGPSRNPSSGSIGGSVISTNSMGSTYEGAKLAEAHPLPVPVPAPPAPPSTPAGAGAGTMGRSRSALSEMVRGELDMEGQAGEADADELEYHNYRDTLVIHCMSGPLSVVKAQCLVTLALKMMQECKKTCLVVNNGLGEEPGIVTKRDFLKAMKRQSMRGVPVGRLQSRPIHSIGVGERVRDAAKLMNRLKIRRLLVHDASSQPTADKTLAYVGEVTEDTLMDLSVSNSEHDSHDTPTGSSEVERVPQASALLGPVVPVPIVHYEDRWEIKFQDLQLLSRIGQGSFGEVWQGRWRSTDVAVKRVWGLHGSFEEAAHAATEFEREITMLSQLRHPNVVMFLGACRVPPDIALVMEYCPRGTLHRLLHRSSVPLPLPMRIKMAMHVARGMLALHTSLPRIIHRDLKSANLLVGASFEIKVCDFGLSRTMAHCAANCSNRSQSSFGTVEYAAPEVLRGEPYSEKCDVWSFGVVLWELLMRKRPYYEVTHSVSIIAGVSLGKLGLSAIPPDVADPGLAALVGICCSQHPAGRPSFVEIIQYLEDEVSRMKGGGSTGSANLPARSIPASSDRSTAEAATLTKSEDGPSPALAHQGSLPLGQEAAADAAVAKRRGSAPEQTVALLGDSDRTGSRSHDLSHASGDLAGAGPSPLQNKGEPPMQADNGKSPFEDDADEDKSPFEAEADEGKSPFEAEADEGNSPFEAEAESDWGKSPFEAEAEEG